MWPGNVARGNCLKLKQTVPILLLIVSFIYLHYTEAVLILQCTLTSIRIRRTHFHARVFLDGSSPMRGVATTFQQFGSSTMRTTVPLKKKEYLLENRSRAKQLHHSIL